MIFSTTTIPQATEEFLVIAKLVATRWRPGGDPEDVDVIIKLTKRAVESIAPKDKRAIYYDTELKGFCLKITPSGAKTWCVEYRAAGTGRKGNKQRLTIGSAAAISADNARTAAKKILSSVALGNDPASARRKAKQSPTLREFGELYLQEVAKTTLKPRTYANYVIYLRKHAFPGLGNLKVDRVSNADIARLHNEIGKSKRATANRVIECLSSVFRYASDCGIVLRGNNPCAHIKAFKEVRRERFLTNEELLVLGETLREAQSVGLPWKNGGKGKRYLDASPREIICPLAIAAMRLLLFTGARLREILHLEWDWIDSARGLLLLPDSKTGRKTIYLNAPAKQILASIPRTSRYVFPNATGSKPRADLNRPWRAVIRHSKLKSLRLHDLRHTHASIGAAAGIGLFVLGKLLGHSQSSTTERYAHLEASPIQQASETVAKRISLAMGESSSTKDSARSSRSAAC